MNLEADFRQHKISKSNGEIGVLEMPYKDEDFAMYLILPPEDSDIRDFNWTDINFKDLDSRMRSELTKVQLPKSRIEYQKLCKQRTAYQIIRKRAQNLTALGARISGSFRDPKNELRKALPGESQDLMQLADDVLAEQNKPYFEI